MNGDKKSLFGEQMNGITVVQRTKYKTYMQASIGKLITNMQANRSTRLKRILEETNEEEGEAEAVLKFLVGKKENRVWYKGSYYALGNLDDTFSSQMQRLQGNALQEKDLDPPRSVIEARSILCRDTTKSTDPSSYIYF